MTKSSLSYKKSGVDYDVLDTVKRMALKAGFETKHYLDGSGFKTIEKSRGESAFVIESRDCYYAFVQEGLGTKTLVADEVRKITGKTYYDSIAQDTVAMIINDLITTGAKPLIIMAYWAAGSSAWYSDKKRIQDLVFGWKKACDLAKVSWGGGETPTLKGVINEKAIDLGGSSFGIIKPKHKLVLGDKLTAGDAIILLESSGIHANGLTLAREIANNLLDGYKTKLSDGAVYGDELLKHTIIYSRLIQDLLENNIDIHYMINITGHGWRKLIRAKKNLTYIIDAIPSIPEIFKFIQKHSRLPDREMYATFNMGAGFAMMVSPQDTNNVLQLSNKHKIKAWVAGKVEKGKRQVMIKPLNISFTEKDLKIR